MFKRKKVIKQRKESRKHTVLYLILFFCLVIGIASVFLYKKYVHYFRIPTFMSSSVTLPTPVQTKNTLTSLLAQKGITYTKIISTQSEYIIILTIGSQVILSNQKDLYAQISSLQFILSRLTMEGRQFSKLDERFDNPVIVFRK